MLLEEFISKLQELGAPPDARVVTDVGRSMCSGWGGLSGMVYIPEYNAVELFFED